MHLQESFSLSYHAVIEWVGLEDLKDHQNPFQVAYFLP